MATNQITEGEIQFMKFQLNAQGSFMKSLINTIMLADDKNMGHLVKVYPDLVMTIHRFHNEPGYFENLCKRWNGLYPTQTIIA